MIYKGDCVAVMSGSTPESVDSIVTDPPYDLTSTGARKGSPRQPGTGPYSRGFMGHSWDGAGVSFQPETWEAALRVAKPGAYLLAFGGTRTVHRLACAIEDAGWEIRDMLMWGYGTGFPKSKALLKPAFEPIVMARKPGPLRELRIDECRIGPPMTEAEIARSGRGTDHAFGKGGIDWKRNGRHGEASADARYGDRGIGLQPTPGPRGGDAAGRWPANLVLTDPILDGGYEGIVGGGTGGGRAPASGPTWSGPSGSPSRAQMSGVGDREPRFYADSGGISRFFYIPKASKKDREPDILPDDWPEGTRFNTHPTVKPTRLMRHLIRLVTPPDGVVLDPFLGSGSTAKAAVLEGIKWIGIEKEDEYVRIAMQRLVGLKPDAEDVAA